MILSFQLWRANLCSQATMLSVCLVVLSEAVDRCICFTRKIQHGGDWDRSRPQGPKNVHNFSLTVRPLSWACGHGTEMLLILKNLFLTWLLPDIFRYNSPNKCPTILYAVNLWLKPVSVTGASCRYAVVRFAFLHTREGVVALYIGRVGHGLKLVYDKSGDHSGSALHVIKEAPY